MKVALEIIKRIFLLVFVCPRTVLDDGTLIIAADDNELHARVAQHELTNGAVSVTINGITYSRKEVNNSIMKTKNLSKKRSGRETFRKSCPL